MTTNGVGEQAEPTSDTTGHDAVVPENTSDVTAEDAEDQDDQDHDQGDVDSDQDGGSRRSREKHYRQRAQAAEAERDQLRAQVEALQQDAVDQIAAAAGVNPELLTAAGYELASLIGDDGRVDRTAATEACADTRTRYNIARKPGNALLPNEQQGAHGVPRATGGVAGVIKQAMGR